jgi:hypothetical protein
VGKRPFPIFAHQSLNIIGRIFHLIALGAVTDLQNQAIELRPIFEVVSGTVRCKSRHHAGTKLNFACVREQSWLTLHHIDELVLAQVLVVKRGYRAVRFTPKLLSPNKSPNGLLTRPATREANGSG